MTRKLLFCLLFATQAAGLRGAATLEQVIAAKEDLWADQAMAESNGPSAAFFRSLLPPLHYVNTDFLHYPIVLGLPASVKKSRLVSNGSGINVHANTRSWHEPGTPMLFRVGNDEEAYGQFLEQLHGPKWLDGYLPVVQLRYHHGEGEYAQETFASAFFASNTVTCSRFAFKSNNTAGRDKGRVAIRIDTPEPLKAESGRILNPRGQVLLWFERGWKWEPARHVLAATLADGGSAAVAIPCEPMPGETPSPLAAKNFDQQRALAVEFWKTNVLASGLNIETPEAEVNNAWRALVMADFSLIHGDRIFYSAGNQYEQLYEQEGSEAALALLDYGYETEARRLLPPLLAFTRKGLEFHQAGFKLADICQYYWQTRDAAWVNSLRPRWQKEVDRLAENRSPANGLYPREQYCGDIPTPVFSLNSNAKGWRALRDVAAMLDDMGDAAEAARLHKIADEFHARILAALQKSMPNGTTFVPNALLGEENPYDVITDTRMGGYWNLMANNILGSEVLGQGTPAETGLMKYFQEHGGLCIGLIRSRAWPAFWVGTANMNPLYGWPYARALLRRDEPERALVSFYGMLANGLTPDTFTCGEACALQPVDKWGRQFYCPPNSAGNAFWLEMLRNLLVQDWALNDAGRPDTLRLLFATPKRWLADGNTIVVERAPTAFGLVSVRIKSELNRGQVVAKVDLPNRNPPARAFLRARLPDGWRVQSADFNGRVLASDQTGAVDLSGFKGSVEIHFKVVRQ